MANTVLVAAAAGAAVVILRTPALRRVAIGLLRTAVVSAIPAWVAREVRHAWAASNARVVMAEDTPDGVAPQPPGDGFPAPSPVYDAHGSELPPRTPAAPG